MDQAWPAVAGSSCEAGADELDGGETDEGAGGDDCWPAVPSERAR